MKFNAIVSCLLALLLAGALPAQGEQSPDARQKLESLAPALKGAATATRRRILEDFRKELDGKTVSFTGTVWSLGTIALDQTAAGGPDVRQAIFSWEYQGILIRSEQPSEETPTDRVKRRLGGADKGTLIIVRSGKFQLYALTASPQIVDGLRQGKTITIEAQITGLREDSLLGFVTSIRDAGTDPQCPQGHELPAGHDFLFCPYCGEPLK